MVWKIENPKDGMLEMSLYAICEMVFTGDDIGFTATPFNIKCLIDATVNIIPVREIIVNDSADDLVCHIRYATIDSGTTLVIREIIISPQYKRFGILTNLILEMKRIYDVIYVRSVYNNLMKDSLLHRDFFVYSKHDSNLPTSLNVAMTYNVKDVHDDIKNRRKYYEKGFDIIDMYWTSLPSFRPSKVDKGEIVKEDESIKENNHTGLVGFIKNIILGRDK